MLHSDIIFMFLSTIVKKEFFFDTRAVVAHRSWGRRETLIYVVEGDDAAAARWAGCPAHDVGVAGAPLRKCLGEPPVLLAPGCTSKYYGAPGPCCKYDYGVAWFARSTLAASARFFVFADDDVWFSSSGFRDLLSRYPDPATTAFALHPDGYRAIWGHPECRHDPKTGDWGIRSGWHQPAVLSIAAVHALANQSAAGVMTAICAAYGITHDVGFGVLLWQNEVLVGGFGRCAARQSTEPALKDAQVVVHGARAPTKANERYLNHSALTAFFEDRGWNGSACYAKHAKVIGQLDRLNGVRETRWFARGGEGIFSPEDCAVEQNAVFRARNESERTCWCGDRNIGGAWPKTKECRGSCPPGRRRLSEECATRGWCRLATT